MFGGLPMNNPELALHIINDAENNGADEGTLAVACAVVLVGLSTDKAQSQKLVDAVWRERDAQR